MGQDMPEENLSRVVVDLRNEPEGIAFNVEHGEFTHSIRRGKHLPDFHEAIPPRLSGDPVPDIQGPAEAGMFVGGFEQLLPADDVQDLPRLH